MKRTVFLAAAAVIALQPAPVDAQIFNGTPFSLEYQDFVGGSGVNGTYGVQVGPYRSRFLGSGLTPRATATPQFSVYCVDYFHYASRSDGLVNVSSLGGDLSNTRLNDYGSYQRSAYLSSLFDDGVWQVEQANLASIFGGTFTRNNVWGGLHAAIWDVSTGPSGLGSGQTAVARDYFLGLASDNAGSFDTSNWYVLSEADVDLGSSMSGQEFLMRTAAVPEPSAILLMLTGLFLLVGVNRRRIVDTHV